MLSVLGNAVGGQSEVIANGGCFGRDREAFAAPGVLRPAQFLTMGESVLWLQDGEQHLWSPPSASSPCPPAVAGIMSQCRDTVKCPLGHQDLVLSRKPLEAASGASTVCRL